MLNLNSPAVLASTARFERSLAARKAAMDASKDNGKCVICDAPARFFYPAPMCVPCNRDWAE